MWQNVSLCRCSPILFSHPSFCVFFFVLGHPTVELRFLAGGRNKNKRARESGLEGWALVTGNIWLFGNFCCGYISSPGFLPFFSISSFHKFTYKLLPASVSISQSLLVSLSVSLSLSHSLSHYVSISPSLCAQPATGMYLEERLARRTGSNELRAALEPGCLLLSPSFHLFARSLLIVLCAPPPVPLSLVPCFLSASHPTDQVSLFPFLQTLSLSLLFFFFLCSFFSPRSSLLHFPSPFLLSFSSISLAR